MPKMTEHVADYLEELEREPSDELKKYVARCQHANDVLSNPAFSKASVEACIKKFKANKENPDTEIYNPYPPRKNADADLSSENEALKKRIAELEEQMDSKKTSSKGGKG